MRAPSAQSYQGSRQAPSFPCKRSKVRFQRSRIPMLQGSKVTGLQESTAGFDCFKTPRFQSSGTGFQSSPGFQACNVRGHKLQTCTRIPRIQVSKVLGLLQGFRVSGFPRFQDLMTYETTRHVKERKMQTKLWLMERLLQDFQQRVSARFMPGFQQRFR